MEKIENRWSSDMRYAIAFTVCIVLIGGAALYVQWTNRTIESYVRQKMRQAQQAGKLAPEIDVETADISNLSYSLPWKLEMRVVAAIWLKELGYLWVPLVLGISFGTAAMRARASRVAGLAAASS